MLDTRQLFRAYETCYELSFELSQVNMIVILRMCVSVWCHMVIELR